jgi:hypothetical protein
MINKKSRNYFELQKSVKKILKYLKNFEESIQKKPIPHGILKKITE